MERRVIEGYHEAILAKLGDFCDRQKVKLSEMALNSLQELRDIKITQCKHKVSHFY